MSPVMRALREKGGMRTLLADTGNRVRLIALAAAVALVGYLRAVDPEDGGVPATCPSRTLLGIDCPACGGLRGTSDLLNGRVGEALDHNLLLPGLLAFLGTAFVLWLLPLVGRPTRMPSIPPWVMATTLGVLMTFMVLRNLPISTLEFLGSDASP